MALFASILGALVGVCCGYFVLVGGAFCFNFWCSDTLFFVGISVGGDV